MAFAVRAVPSRASAGGTAAAGGGLAGFPDASGTQEQYESAKSH